MTKVELSKALGLGGSIEDGFRRRRIALTPLLGIFWRRLVHSSMAGKIRGFCPFPALTLMVEEEDWFEDWIFILVVEDMSFLLGVEEEMVEEVRFFFLCIVEGL